MSSNFQFCIDLNQDDDQNHQEQPFFYPLGSSSSSSISSLSSYLPAFLINSQEDQHLAYNNTYHHHHVDHLHLSQPLEAKMFVANGGSSSSYDHMMPKKETRLKLTIRKKDHHQDQTALLHQNPTKPHSGSDKWMISPKMRLIKKTITNYKQPIHNTKTSSDEDHKKVSTTENRHNTINENGYGNNNGVLRVCSDCNTTKTPLWRSGPRGPKSLCNACGIRQRKARRAAIAAATVADEEVVVAARLQHLPVKKKKNKSNGGDQKYNISPPEMSKAKKYKIKEEDSDMIIKSETCSNSSISSNKLCFEDLTIILSKNAAYNQKVFPQDEKEAAILLMALSYGMVHA